MTDTTQTQYFVAATDETARQGPFPGVRNDEGHWEAPPEFHAAMAATQAAMSPGKAKALGHKKGVAKRYPVAPSQAKTDKGRALMDAVEKLSRVYARNP